MTFSFGPNAPYSTSLSAEAFGMPLAEAEADFAALLAAGAQPFSIHEAGAVLSEGIGIPFSVEGRWLLYLYALATERAARGRGLLRTLLKEVAEGAAGAGYSALTLLPATVALAGAYGRMGFTERYFAGGAPVIRTGEDLFLKIQGDLPVEEADRGVLYRALGRHLSPALFDFTLSTLGGAILPARMGDAGYALLLRDDPTRALSASEDVACEVDREGAAFLLCPLRGRPPRRLPEPMPR